MTMLDRIIMYVVEMIVHIELISDNMVPKTPLPNPVIIMSVFISISAGKRQLNPFHQKRQVVSHAVNQKMKMVRQYGIGYNLAPCSFRQFPERFQ